MMNVKKLLILLSIVSPTFAVSCLNRGAGVPLSIPYVKGILADTASVEYGIVRNGCPDGREGVISVIGPAEDAFVLADGLLACDYFDNVDGRRNPDGLPDFAGETLSVVCDNANTPYGGYLDSGNEKYLRELTVRNFISALDTVCASSPFDMDESVRKRGSKVVILASSYSSAFGYADIRALLDAAEPDINVISPVHSMFSHAIDRHGEDGTFAVWTTEAILGAGVYSSVWADVAEDCPSFKYDAFCPQATGALKERMLSFFRMYRSAGQKKRLDAVIVDDIPLKADSLNAALTSMMESADDSISVYRNMLSDGFEFIGAAESVASDCIKFLRGKNMFTHRVAYPSMQMYETVPVAGLPAADYGQKGDFTEKFKYNRAENTDLETYVLVEAAGGFLDGPHKEFLRRNAHKAYEQYVSK